jgi:hypothetical protein
MGFSSFKTPIFGCSEVYQRGEDEDWQYAGFACLLKCVLIATLHNSAKVWVGLSNLKNNKNVNLLVS